MLRQQVFLQTSFIKDYRHKCPSSSPNYELCFAKKEVIGVQNFQDLCNGCVYLSQAHIDSVYKLNFQFIVSIRITLIFYQNLFYHSCTTSNQYLFSSRIVHHLIGRSLFKSFSIKCFQTGGFEEAVQFSGYHM